MDSFGFENPPNLKRRQKIRPQKYTTVLTKDNLISYGDEWKKGSRNNLY